MKDASPTSTHFVSARVTEAPALGGTPMFELKIACRGHSSTMYKTREDFKSVLNMFKLVHGMARNRGEHCAVCAHCSAFSMLRVCDAQTLDAFLHQVLMALRPLTRDELRQCSSHRGVVQILMDFLGVSNGKYFSDLAEAEFEVEKETRSKNQDERVHTGSNNSSSSNNADKDVELPITSHCALLRSISDHFAAMDSVC